MKVPGVKIRNIKCLDLQRRGKRFFGRLGRGADSDNNWLQSLPEIEGSTLVQVEPHRGSFRFMSMVHRDFQSRLLTFRSVRGLFHVG